MNYQTTKTCTLHRVTLVWDEETGKYVCVGCAYEEVHDL